VVETVAGDASLGETWRRHLRWSRTIRASRPAGHLGLLFTFGTVWSLALATAAGGAAPWAWFACACFALRCASAAIVARAVGAQLGSAWLLLPAADLWAFCVWAASFGGRSVEWRGRTLRLDRQGRILRED
jgi:ceramide glucosyltransferase